VGRYRKIDTRIWNDAKFRALSDNGKLAFFFLLTHPHMTSLGAMRGTVRGLAAEMEWQEKAFREALGEAFAKGMAEVDEKACFVCLPNFLKYNKPESPNVVKSWEESLDLIPECNGKVTLLQRVKDFTEGLSEGFKEALPEAFRKAMPNQEQEQEQEHKQEQEQDSTPQPPAAALEFLATWNATKGVRPVRKLGARASTLKARLAEPDWDWRAALEKFPLRCFATEPDGFVPDLEFFLRPDTVNKILEGKYDWEKGNGKQRPLAIGPGQSHNPAARERDPNYGRM
jgi:hypothetical protein